MAVTTGSSSGLPTLLPYSDIRHRDMHTPDAFKRLKVDGSVMAYSHLAVNFVTFIVATALDNVPSEVAGVLPHSQKKAALAYEDAVARGTGQEDALLHDLLLNIFTHKVCDSGVSLPSYRFLALYSFREDGSLDIGNNITQVISKLVFVGRAAMYNSIVARVRPPDVGFFELSVNFEHAAACD